MASPRAINPGRTSRYYQSEKGRESYEKQKEKQKIINETPKNKNYRKLLARRRRAEGWMGKGGGDVSHPTKTRRHFTRESMKINRGRK